MVNTIKTKEELKKVIGPDNDNLVVVCFYDNSESSSKTLEAAMSPVIAATPNVNFHTADFVGGMLHSSPWNNNQPYCTREFKCYTRFLKHRLFLSLDPEQLS
jgi:hypothetical protein